MSTLQSPPPNNLANGISVIRLVSAPVVVWLLMNGHDAAALAVFILAAFSDAADGFLARHVVGVSEIGAILDPLADKTVLVAVYITLGFRGLLPDWLVILVVFRDLMIVGGALLMTFLFHRPTPVQPAMLSKINTAAQIVLAAVVMAGLVLVLPWGGLVDSLVVLVAVTTAASGLLYLGRWLRGLI